MDQININEFFTSCGPTSTPKMKNQRISRSRMCINRDIAIPLSNKDTVTRLLESKDAWPIAFSKASQNHLNGLQLGLSEDFLLKQVEKEKSKRMSPMILRRSRSRNRDRSMSPSGAMKMKESKWDTKMEIALLLIDHILSNHEELPERFLMHQPDWKSESKELIDMLSKNLQNKARLDKLGEANFFVVGQSLRLVLEKMGVLLPAIISHQILQLRWLKSRNGNIVINNQSKIEAVQILMLHITKPSRILIQKLLDLFHILSNVPHVKMNQSQLALILHPSLFEGDNNTDSVKLCMDLIALSDKIFQAPFELLMSLKETINTRPKLINMFTDKSEKPINTPAKSKYTTPSISLVKPSPKLKTTLPATRCISGKTITSFFPNSKRILQPESIILTGFIKISSPEYSKKSDSDKFITQPKSIFIEKTKKIYKKSMSPFKRNKEYLLPNLSNYKKPRLSEK